MKVICALCNKLEDEEKAVRMSRNELDNFRTMRLNIPMMSSCHETWMIKSTQICESCYNNYGKEVDNKNS